MRRNIFIFCLALLTASSLNPADAPKKYFAGNYYNTYFVNLLVILGMTIICLIALYYNLLSKLINGIQHIAFKIQLKKRN
jgi:hypothetical protein